MMKDEEKYVGWKLYALMVGMLITGTANTLIQKYQDETFAANNYFSHPYLQCGVMFFGEFSCWGLYFIDVYI